MYICAPAPGLFQCARLSPNYDFSLCSVAAQRKCQTRSLKTIKNGIQKELQPLFIQVHLFIGVILLNPHVVHLNYKVLYSTIMRKTREKGVEKQSNGLSILLSMLSLW